MKVKLLYVAGAKEAFASLAEEIYLKKIKGYCQFEIEAVKAKNVDGDNSEYKKAAESEALIKKISPGEYVVLLDEKGEVPKSSRQFAEKLSRAIDGGRPVVFVIGGAFGSSAELKKRAQWQLSLSPLTFNHHVAKVVALEQIFRAFTILRGHPYHND